MLSKSIYFFLAKVFGFGIRILLPIVLVRILTKDDFGAYSQFFLLEILVKTLFQMGVTQSLYYFVPRDMDNAGAYLMNSLFLNLVTFAVAYILFYFFRAPIAAQLGMQIIKVYFWYLACYSLLMLFNTSVITYLAARQEILQASLLTILREALASIGTLSAAYFTRDLKTIILALIVSRGIALAIGLIYVHFRLHGFRSQRYYFGMWDQIKYGFVLGIGGAIGVYSMRFNELMVSRNYDLSTYAVYTAGCKQIPMLQFFSQSIAAVALGQFAMLVKNEDWAGVKRLWNKILGTMYGIGIPSAVLILIISKPLVIAMFTPEYAGAVPIFRFNVVAKLAMILNASLVLRALDRNDVTLKINATMFLLMPVGLYGGMKIGGPAGIAAANMILLILTQVISLAYLNRLSPVYLPFVSPFYNVKEFYLGTYKKSRSLIAEYGSRLIGR